MQPEVDRLDDAMTEEPCISLNILSGHSGFQTMRVIGYVGKKPVHILIDSGNTR